MRESGQNDKSDPPISGLTGVLGLSRFFCMLGSIPAAAGRSAWIFQSECLGDRYYQAGCLVDHDRGQRVIADNRAVSKG